MFRLSSRLPLTALLGVIAYDVAHAQRPEAAQTPPTAPTPQAALANEPETPPEFAVWAGYAESDNLTRTTDPERGSYNSVGVLLSAAHDSTRLTGSINSNVEVRKYSLEDIDNETIGKVAGIANVHLVGDVFHWRFREDYDQGRTDAFSAIGPGNRETINVFSSGPRLDLTLGQRTTLTMNGDYSTRRYEDSVYVDSDSVVYDVGLLRTFSETTQIGIVARTNDIDYVDASIAPYTIDTAYLRYGKMLATGQALVEWGTNELSSQGSSTDAPYFFLEWFRDLTARSRFSLGATRQLTDSGGLAAPSISEAPPPAESDVLLSTAPLDRRGLQVSYLIAAPRTNASIRVTATEDRYFGDSTLDNDALTTSLAISHSVSMLLKFGLTVDNVVREFAGTAVAREDDEDQTMSAWVDRALGRRFSISLVLSQYRRRGNEAFDEDRCEVRFSYSPTGSASAALPSAGR